jgi:multidrug transporter EmrE-like cation transporter
MQAYLLLGLLVFAALLETAGDIFLKKWHIDARPVALVLAAVVYLFSIMPWFFALRTEELSKAIVIVGVLNLLIGVAFGVLYFNESLSTMATVGIILGIVSIILIQFG